MSMSMTAPYEVKATEERSPLGIGFALSLAILVSIPLWWAIIWVAISVWP
jgi:hypothetical protein